MAPINIVFYKERLKNLITEWRTGIVYIIGLVSDYFIFNYSEQHFKNLFCMKCIFPIYNYILFRLHDFFNQRSYATKYCIKIYV